ncbi:hypothetical protein L0P88_04060 [Muricauda sp. SCSIO 64092]|uniref:hypothetical protein n=1 Tax=Allomuricauda sp. SCSIO 64092 TaxID=2908842 RepID=UPI001FF5736C|nr:hypothetical protein [Muricauda sp. SCSIO 64092]UOY07729.1 hypothetical protein L0P88_04060 [Muricauda sp. SCSIO 64092]
MIAYKPKYFTIRELVHPWILKALGELNCWLRLDSGSLKDIDRIRERWGDVIYINHGNHDSRGLRPPNDPDGSWYSTHKMGGTFDLVPRSGEYIRLWAMVEDMIKKGELKTLNTLEDVDFTPGWVHVAKMNTSLRPLIIKP